VLGAIRELLVRPRLGPTVAVAIELPVMLGASWIVCRWMIERFAVASRPVPRLVMGGSAFLWLMAAEVGLSAAAFGLGVTDYLRGLAVPSAWIGLSGQIVFAAFPVVRLALTSDHERRPGGGS
jgi:hypothetical protein